MPRFDNIRIYSGMALDKKYERMCCMKYLICFLSLIVFLCASLFVCPRSSHAADSDGTLKVTFLDVGKGDCILIEKDGHNVLIDAGYEETSEDVLSFLQQNGTSHLDHFIITHYDKDHVGGAPAIIQSIAIDNIWLPGYEDDGNYYTGLLNVLEQESLSGEKVTQDVSFTLADVNFTIFATEVEYDPPTKKNEGNDNDVSLVIEMKYADDSWLFAGDIEEDGVKKFVSAGHGTYDVVKMPHHGRKDDKSDDFIDSTQPQIAVITDSKDDEADKKLVKALEKTGAEVYRTSKCGQIVITGNGTGEYIVDTQK